MISNFKINKKELVKHINLTISALLKQLKGIKKLICHYESIFVHI